MEQSVKLIRKSILSNAVLQAASVLPSPSLHTPACQSLDPSPLQHEQICRPPTLAVRTFCYRLTSLTRQRTTKIKRQPIFVSREIQYW